MDVELLIQQGNAARDQNNPNLALKCYAQAFVEDPQSSAAFNNYGNVLREMGYPARSIPFLEHSLLLDPSCVTAEFNLSVARLLMGHYKQGWPLYESRWRYEHLANTKPQLSCPEWTGEPLQGKTILVIGEQGLGDQIQFSRFATDLHRRGAQVKLHVTDSIKPLFVGDTRVIQQVTCNTENIGPADYWITMMSLPGLLGVTVENLGSTLQYIFPDREKVSAWSNLLGPKKRMRIGFAWSGRKDSWINQHKSMPVDTIASLIQRHPEHQWINLQVDASVDEDLAIKSAGADTFPGTISDFSDTAALMMNLDLVISVDTAVAHLAGALARPVWIPLNSYAPCWRWMLDRDSSPWYPSARLFRQEKTGDWSAPVAKIEKFLSWFKI